MDISIYSAQIAKTCDAEGTCDKLAAEAKARSQANHERLLKCAEVGNCAAIRAEIDSGSNAINALDAKLSDGAASKIIRGYTFIGGDNLNDWTLAGQLHLSYIAKLYNSNDPAWLREGSLYLDQTGFSPFGINPAALAGVRAAIGEGLAGSSTNTKSPSIDGIDGVAKSPTTGGGTLKPEISPDAEAGMHYNDPVAGGGITKATGAKGFGKVEGTYSAVKPGPLTDNIAETFSGGRYSVVTLEKDTVLYRAGTTDKPLGQFFSSEPPTGVIQTRIDKAVLPEWPGGAKSPIDTVFEIKIPAGTRVYVGEVGSQGGFYVGGTQQIVVQKPWLVDGVQVINSSPLK